MDVAGVRVVIRVRVVPDDIGAVGTATSALSLIDGIIVVDILSVDEKAIQGTRHELEESRVGDQIVFSLLLFQKDT